MDVNNIVWLNPAFKMDIDLNAPNLEEALGITEEGIKRLSEAQEAVSTQVIPNFDGELSQPELVLVISSVCQTANELVWMMMRLGGFLIEEGFAEHGEKHKSSREDVN